MSRVLAVFLLLGALLQPARAADAQRDRLPDAPDLLARVIGALPDIPLLILGDLQARARGGGATTRLNVEMLLDWQDAPPTARYTLRDAFGATRSHLAITWLPGAPPEHRYFEGQPLQAAPLPDLVAPIEGTDISWMDLSLSFLWWPDAKTVGAEEVKGRACYVVDLPAPPEPFTGCAGVRLWIEPRINIMLRAEAYDADNTLMRRMDVKSFKKINKRWVIKDIELTSLPSRHKTFLRVRDVQDRSRKSFLPDDAGPGEEVPDTPGDEVDAVEAVPVDAGPPDVP